eukprot:comp6382_c0_seq1/m.2183 comp6382_c0_seq1/g.2183  ORF comp6382_c0_seq1/g.2183 comp6382_c0_seq1/m.2183 type:complete len:522 (-) comp6382_c0_seq1:221-1786(-)
MEFIKLVENCSAFEQLGHTLLRDVKEASLELQKKADRLEAERLALEREREALEEERARFLAEQESVRQLEAHSTDRVTLDVGGRPFTTARLTLCSFQQSMLAAWFSGRHTLHTVGEGKDGAVFIDRSPVLFEYVLDYLRTKGEQPWLPADEGLRERLRHEFDFFCLPWPEKREEPPVMEVVRGEMECVTLDGDFPTGAFMNVLTLDAASNRALLLMRDGLVEGLGLWDTLTGKRIKVWGQTDEVLGRLLIDSLVLQDQYVVLKYKQGDMYRIVLCSSGDGSFVRAYETIHDFIEAFVHDGKVIQLTVAAITARDLASGAICWTTHTDHVLGIDRNRSTEAIVGHTEDGFLVLAVNEGSTVYQIHGINDVGTGSRDVHVIGKSIRAIWIQEHTVDPDVFCVCFGEWDESGNVIVARTPLPSLGMTLGANHVVRFITGDTICVCTSAGFHVFNLTFESGDGNEGTRRVTVNECVSVRLGDEDWWANVDEYCPEGNQVGALGGDGKVKVWRPRKRKSKKRARVE